MAREIMGVALLSLFLTGCSGYPSPPIESPSSGNFHLYVSNQSRDIDPVDIQIYIDSVQVVNDTFRVHSQHTWILFDLDLEPGEHTLQGVAYDGDTELVEIFNISDEHWGLVGFWSDAHDAPVPMLSFQFASEPLVFD